MKRISKNATRCKSCANSLSSKIRHKESPFGVYISYPLGYWQGKTRSESDKQKMREAKLGRCGEETNNWRGGITPVREKIRKMFEYRQWRSDVFTRDDYTCQICNIKGGDMNADHYPKMFAEILDQYEISDLREARECDELWNINNGRTLCKQCHRKTFTGVAKKPWQK